MYKAHHPAVLPLRNGVSPSCVALPSAGQGSMLDFLAQRLPAVSCAQWLERLEAALIDLLADTPFLNPRRKRTMPDELLQRLRRFHEHTFPGVQDQFQDLVREGQHPTILFIGCSDSRLVPYLLTGAQPGERLLDPAVLFFFFGLFAAAVRSNLEVPPAIAKFFSLYLLMSIGFKGGVSLAQTGFTTSMLLALGAVAARVNALPPPGKPGGGSAAAAVEAIALNPARAPKRAAPRKGRCFTCLNLR